MVQVNVMKKKVVTVNFSSKEVVEIVREHAKEKCKARGGEVGEDFIDDESIKVTSKITGNGGLILSFIKEEHSGDV